MLRRFWAESQEECLLIVLSVALAFAVAGSWLVSSQHAGDIKSRPTLQRGWVETAATLG
jgi:hypothetical protein